MNVGSMCALGLAVRGGRKGRKLHLFVSARDPSCGQCSATVWVNRWIMYDDDDPFCPFEQRQRSDTAALYASCMHSINDDKHPSTDGIFISHPPRHRSAMPLGVFPCIELTHPVLHVHVFSCSLWTVTSNNVNGMCSES